MEKRKSAHVRERIEGPFFSFLHSTPLGREWEEMQDGGCRLCSTLGTNGT